MKVPRPKLAVYWASGCGGCEVALLNLGERFLELGQAFEIVFFPMLRDRKMHDLRAEPDGSIDLCLFTGAIHTPEDEEMADLLRRKSRRLVAFGSCAQEGCVPGLANLSSSAQLLRTVYSEWGGCATSSLSPPQELTSLGKSELRLPALLDEVRTLDQVTSVDYAVPGCPPEGPMIRLALDHLEAGIAAGEDPAGAGTILGAEPYALCEQCPATRQDSSVRVFRRAHEFTPDPDICLLEQGWVCSGIATRAGCGALCIRVGMACRGCYGAVEEDGDQGARMVAALASSMELDPDCSEEEIEEALASIVDPVGTLYRFGLARSILRGARRESGVDP